MQQACEVMGGARAALTCLIVDDSAFMRFHLRRMMDSIENVIASEAANGNEAITEYGRLRPDIVLMDIVMPGLEGVETVRRICETDPRARNNDQLAQLQGKGAGGAGRRREVFYTEARHD